MSERHCRLEPLLPDDVSSLTQLAGPWSDEWSPQTLHDSLLAGHQGVMLFDQEVTCGYGVYRLLPEVMEMLNIAIFYPSRSKGYGRILIDRLKVIAIHKGCRKIWLEVRATNTPALALYRSSGFEVSGQRREYYRCEDGSRADAILMEKTIDPL